MISLLDDFPEQVVAARASGIIHKTDYEEVLISAVAAACKRHPKVRCYYELGPDFEGMDAGALWEDFALGFKHYTHWERVAVVTDVEWVRLAVNTFRFLMPGQFKTFHFSQAQEAKTWISSS